MTVLLKQFPKSRTQIHNFFSFVKHICNIISACEILAANQYWRNIAHIFQYYRYNANIGKNVTLYWKYFQLNANIAEILVLHWEYFR